MQKLKTISYYGFWALLIYMPFHIFLSQWLSLYTGGLDEWKIAKDVVLAILTVFTICLVYGQGKSTKLFTVFLSGTVLYGALHLLLWLTHPHIYGPSAELGIIYNMRLPAYALLGYGTVLLQPQRFAIRSVLRVVLIVSTIVASLGILQYFLPSDLLSHFGYSIARGARPVFYIDDNHNLPIRIMSTLREPNALGAYLILPTTALFALVLKLRDKRYTLGGALLVHVVAMVLTQSRSALLGLLLAWALVVYWQYNGWILTQLRRFWLLLTIAIVILSTGLFSLRNTAFFQSYIIHGHGTSQATDLDSNDYHTLFVERGLRGIWSQPLGHGPGTAGLASIQNPNGSFLTENYYVQIGYEVGLLGLVVFIGLNAYVYVLIRRAHSTWGIVLLASFWGYVVTNMLLHTWSNEAVAAQWWLLAGVVMATRNVQTD
jgi:hypothetical protein